MGKGNFIRKSKKKKKKKEIKVKLKHISIKISLIKVMNKGSSNLSDEMIKFLVTSKVHLLLSDEVSQKSKKLVNLELHCCKIDM